MALKQCEECCGNVSTRAEICPHCGAPVTLTQEESLIDLARNIKEVKEAAARLKALNEPKISNDLDRRCVKCGSSNLNVGRVGFRAAHAIAGFFGFGLLGLPLGPAAIVTALLGLFCGFIGRNDLKITCLSCNTTRSVRVR